MDCSPPDSSVHGISQARILEWVKQKYKPNHQQTGLPPHSALPTEEKQTNKKLSPNLTLYEAYTHHWTNLRKAETKRKKEFSLEAWAKEISNTIS
jgi:prophage antirepressor-like protein